MNEISRETLYRLLNVTVNVIIILNSHFRASSNRIAQLLKYSQFSFKEFRSDSWSGFADVRLVDALSEAAEARISEAAAAAATRGQHVGPEPRRGVRGVPRGARLPAGLGHQTETAARADRARGRAPHRPLAAPLLVCGRRHLRRQAAQPGAVHEIMSVTTTLSVGNSL